MGDFNAELRKRGKEKEIAVGNFGTGNRNERRRMLVDLALDNNKQLLQKKA